MGFVSPYTKITCPSCNNKYHLGDFEVVSRVTSNKVLYTPPKLRPTPETNKLKLAWSRVWVKSPDDFEKELARLRCPNCQNILPRDTTEESITIAIIGDTYSGKTHFITVVIDLLAKLQIPGGYFEIDPTSQEISDKYQQLHDVLFDLQETVRPTQQTKTDIDEPLIYKITINNADGTRRKFNLLFYDASGEDLAVQTTLVQYKSHILNAKAIIFLADPWSMPEFINRIAANLRPKAKSKRLASQVFASIVDTFREVRPELRGDDFPLPTAIVLPKADLIAYHPVLGDKYEYLWKPEYATLYNTDTDYIDTLTRNFLHDIEEDSLPNRTQSFRSAKFFAISATGSSPDGQNRYVEGIRPHRCLDPLLWIFRELGEIS